MKFDVSDSLEFGVEIETHLPDTSPIEVGRYHSGKPVRSGPSFQGRYWSAEFDRSILAPDGRKPCEFVSPRLIGAKGIDALRDFVAFAAGSGASVNRSCGLHVTVGLRRLLGLGFSDSLIARHIGTQLCPLAHYHRLGVYASTGKGRHLPNPNGVWYSAPIQAKWGDFRNVLTNDAEPASLRLKLRELAEKSGRGYMSLLKVNSADPAIEFRVFGATLEWPEVQLHVATALGLVSRSTTLGAPMTFGTPNPARNPVEAFDALAGALGWTSPRSSFFGFGHGGCLAKPGEIATCVQVGIRNSKNFQELFGCPAV